MSPSELTGPACRPGTLSGRVVDAAGSAVSGAAVMLAQSPEPHRDIARVTAADGRFRFPRMPPGAYRVAVNGGELGLRVADVVVESGLEAEVEIRLGG